VLTGSRPPGRAPLAAHAFALATATVVALACASGALAADDFERDQTPLPDAVTTTTGDGAGSTASGGGGIVRMIVGLAIVLVVIYGVYWLLKAYRKTKSATGDGRLEIVATTVLAPNRSVHLIRVGEELVLVGSAEHGVTRLRVYDPDEAAILAARIDAPPEGSQLAPSRGALALARRPKAGRTTRATATSSMPEAASGRAGVVDHLRWRTVRR
jgi:flagellar protein FliO/FliZ